MKKNITLLLFFFILSLTLEAQTPGDSIQDESDSDNYYSVFHRTIKDSVNNTVLKFGSYISAGPGMGMDFGIKQLDAIFSYSLAYKNNLFSFTCAKSSDIPVRSRSGRNSYVIDYKTFDADYAALLFGQAYRTRSTLIAVSAGIAYTNISVYRAQDLSRPPAPAYYSREGIISFPVELKIFMLAYNGIGIGLHLSKDIVPNLQYAPFYAGLCVVFGHWNHSQKKKGCIDCPFPTF